MEKFSVCEFFIFNRSNVSFTIQCSSFIVVCNVYHWIFSLDEEMDFSTDVESVCDTASMNGMVSGDCRAPSDAGTDSTQESYGLSIIFKSWDVLCE